MFVEKTTSLNSNICAFWPASYHPHPAVQPVSTTLHNSLNLQWIIVIDITGDLSAKELSRFTPDHPHWGDEERSVNNIDHPWPRVYWWADTQLINEHLHVWSSCKTQAFAQAHSLPSPHCISYMQRVGKMKVRGTSQMHKLLEKLGFHVSNLSSSATKK